MAMCESHDVGIVPHFTGPIATAAQAHALATFPFTVVFEYNYQTRRIPYLQENWKPSMKERSTRTTARALASRSIPIRCAW
jgi:L-alanine-DL-glutamate epimerase-like enolase superfamily enzyme